MSFRAQTSHVHSELESELIQEAAVVFKWLEEQFGYMFADVVMAVKAERRYQDEKHGVHDGVHGPKLPNLLWFAILAEEHGEAAMAMLDDKELRDQ